MQAFEVRYIHTPAQSIKNHFCKECFVCPGILKTLYQACKVALTVARKSNLRATSVALYGSFQIIKMCMCLVDACLSLIPR